MTLALPLGDDGDQPHRAELEEPVEAHHADRLAIEFEEVGEVIVAVIVGVVVVVLDAGMPARRGAKVELVTLSAAVAELRTVTPEEFAFAEAFLG